MENMDIDLDIITGISAVIINQRKKKLKVKKRYYVNSYLMKRRVKGRYVKDFRDLLNHPDAFKENYHMSPAVFYKLHELVQAELKPKARSRPDSLSSELKLALTLEFLASGSLQRHIASVYRVSKQRVGIVIEETCNAIYTALKPYIFKPMQSKDWIRVANEYNGKWNLPNCLGSIDGKHVAIKCPQNAGSLFYNYKGFHSVVLMAVSDANYQFLYVNVGAYGSEGDSSVFRDCDFGKQLIEDKLSLPKDVTLLGTRIPFYFVADDAFPLHRRIMKPYTPLSRTPLSADKRIFNYRLSRARRCVENAFGILCCRFLCLAKPLFLNPSRVQKVVLACCALHNYLSNECKEVYIPHGFEDRILPDGQLVEGAWRLNVPNGSCSENTVTRQHPSRPSVCAKTVRDKVCNYLNSSVGSVSWQNKVLN